MGPAEEQAVRDYYEGGAGEEVTVAENGLAWRSIRFRPHVLRDVGEVSLRTDALGSDLATPVLVAPTALHGLAHPEGEAATRRGAAAAGSLMVLSTRSSVPLERVADAATGPWWMQIYAMRDRSLTLELAARAAAAGARALVLTGDTPVVGVKKRPATGLDVADLHLRNLRVQTGRDLTAADVQQDPTVDLGFIGRLREASGLPVLVKGVLRGDDAERCIGAGAAGLIVSNHGGRQLDRAIPTARALPDVVRVTGGRVPVLVDGGIRDGTDVLAALASGARAVLIGRPVLAALASDGSSGVEEVLGALALGLEQAMRLAGVSSVAEITRDLIEDPLHE